MKPQETRALRASDQVEGEPVTEHEAPPIAPGTTPPPITVEVWAPRDYAEADPIDAVVADVVRINNGWHVVVLLND